MLVRELIVHLQNENPEAQVRWQLFWHSEWLKFDDPEVLHEPEQAFDQAILDQLELQLLYHVPEDEDEV